MLKTVIVFILASVIQLFSQTAIAPSEGDGTEGNPFQIASLENLYWVASSPEHMDKYFIQTADIDASETESWHIYPYPHIHYIGWIQIGQFYTRFSGSYDGQGYIISDLYFDSNENTDRQGKGLFGYAESGAVIKNVNLININYTGVFYTGGLIGNCSGTIVSNCYVHGKILSYTEGGGLVGRSSSSSVVNCVTDVSMTGNQWSGGLIGRNISSEITNCYSIGSVISENDYTGGLIGDNDNSIISYCYSTGVVKASGSYKGGLIGKNESSSISECFWDTEMSGLTTSAGGTGKTTEEMREVTTFISAGWDFLGETQNGTKDIWDIGNDYNFGYPYFTGDVSNLKPKVKTFNVSGITSTGAEVRSLIMSPGVSEVTRYGVCWDTEPLPDISNAYTEDGSTLTYLSYNSQLTGLLNGKEYYVRAYAENSYGVSYGEEIFFSSLAIEPVEPLGSGSFADPYLIANLENLYWITSDPAHYVFSYKQTADIDAAETCNWYSDENGGCKGWLPIGNNYESFTGQYDGQGYKINKLYINRPDEEYTGLFGYTYNGVLYDIEISEAVVNGSDYTGILIGCNYSTNVSNCLINGKVTGSGNSTGGVIGWNHSGGIISGSIFTGSVTANEDTGGLIGLNEYSNIYNCTINADVTGRSGTGGLIGESKISRIENSSSKGRVIGLGGITGSTGGLIGYNNNHPIYGTSQSVLSCFSECIVSGGGTTGGLIGGDSCSDISSCYSSGFVDGDGSTGGLIGFTSQSDIDLSYFLGALKCDNRGGGLIGSASSSSILNCFNIGRVQGYDYIGGLVGESSGSNISDCYSTGNVEGNSQTGGFTGSAVSSTLTNCYSSGAVLADLSPGGLIGLNDKSTLNSSFWNTETSGVAYSDGGTGITTDEMRNQNTFIDAGWDIESVWNINPVYNFGFPYLSSFNIAEQLIINTECLYYDLNSHLFAKGNLISLGSSEITQHGFCWNTNGEPEYGIDSYIELGFIDSMVSFSSEINDLTDDTEYFFRSYCINSSGITYGNTIIFNSRQISAEQPVGSGTTEDPYIISNLNNMYWITLDTDRWSLNYIQVSYIDATETKTWYDAKGWQVIGNGLVKFSGKYNGNGYAINGLAMDRTGPCGFFGYVQNAELSNIVLTNVSVVSTGMAGGLSGGAYSSSLIEDCCVTGYVKGGYYSGGLVGKNDNSVINRCFTSGQIEGIGLVGGLAGWNYTSEINNSYSLCSVTGRDEQVGGFVGRHNVSASINNCYSIGTVSGKDRIGGFIGSIDDATVTSSYWDTETSGIDSSAAGTGLTTAKMKTLSTFIDSGWDFQGETVNGKEDIWDIDPLSNDGYPYLWWITSDIEDDISNIPNEITLYQNYPNPFNPITTIRFSIPSVQDVKLSIYNSNGQLVDVLENSKFSKGSHSVEFNGDKLNSGIYFYRLEAEGMMLTRKMLLIK